MKLTYEAYLTDPSVRDRLIANAHRERAKVVHQLIVEPIKRLFTDHAARPHLARQG